MDLAVAEKLGILESGDHAQDALLLAELQMILEAYQVITVSTQILQAQLDRGVRPPAGARV